jgi:hypothetical protein
MKLIVKYFFLTRHFISGGVVIHLDKYILPWQTFFFWGGGGGHLRLELSCNGVDTIYLAFRVMIKINSSGDTINIPQFNDQ